MYSTLICAIKSSSLKEAKFCWKTADLATWRYIFCFSFQIFNLVPFIKHLPGPHQKIHQNAEELKFFIREAVEEHRITLDSENLRDFIDAYLVEMAKVRYHHDSLLTEKSLMCMQLC